jgi:multiple sugar transport system ATP-binding protein
VEAAGKPALLGIRPEDVEVVDVPKGSETAETFPALLDFVETTGAETFLHLQTGAHAVVSLSARMRRDQPAGRRVRFRFDFERAHLFDPVSTLRLQEL